MPTLKRARDASLSSEPELFIPDTPTPASRNPHTQHYNIGLGSPIALNLLTEGRQLDAKARPSLRIWREDSITSDEEDATDIEQGTSLSGLEDDVGANELSDFDTEDNDVDAVLAPTSPDTPHDTKIRRLAASTDVKGKGKAVDPREYGNAAGSKSDSKLSFAVPQPESVLHRTALPEKSYARGRNVGYRIPSTLNLADPRRIVSPTESIFGLTRRIDSLATDEQDEEDIQHLLEDPDEERSLTPTPTSPSPAPADSSAESEDDRAVTPKPKSSRGQLLVDGDDETDRPSLRHTSSRRIAAQSPSPVPASSESDTETDEPVASPLDRKSSHNVRLLRALCSDAVCRQRSATLARKKSGNDKVIHRLKILAAAVGHDLVPKVSDGLSQRSVGELIDPPEPTYRVPGPVQRVSFGDDEPQTTPETAPTPTPYVDTAPPRKRKAVARLAEPPSSKAKPERLITITDARQRYKTHVPQRKETQRKGLHKKRDDVHRPPRSVAPERCHLHRRSPTSLIPSRDRLRVPPRKLAPRLSALRPLALHRPKGPSPLHHFVHVATYTPIVTGAVYGAALRDHLARQRVRAGMMRRANQRDQWKVDAAATKLREESAADESAKAARAAEELAKAQCDAVRRADGRARAASRRHSVRPGHQRQMSTTDDEEVENLLPPPSEDDMMELDYEFIDAALSDPTSLSYSGSPSHTLATASSSPDRSRSPSFGLISPPRPLKRTNECLRQSIKIDQKPECPEAAPRKVARRALHIDEMQSFAASIKFHLVSRREKKAAVKVYISERKREAVRDALLAEEERRAEEADLARQAVEAQAAFNAHLAQLAAQQAEQEVQAAAREAEERYRVHARQRARAREERAEIAYRRRQPDSIAAQVSTRPPTRRASNDIRRRVHVPQAGPSRARSSTAGPSRATSAEPLTAGATNALGLRLAASPIPRHLPLAAPSAAHAQSINQVLAAAEDPGTPPRYEYPFYPIIRSALPTHLRPVPARPARRNSDPGSPPPLEYDDYMQMRPYSLRSPSPPPPYNALPEGQTLISPVFLRERRASTSESDGGWTRNRPPPGTHHSLWQELNAQPEAGPSRPREQARARPLPVRDLTPSIPHIPLAWPRTARPAVDADVRMADAYDDEIPAEDFDFNNIPNLEDNNVQQYNGRNNNGDEEGGPLFGAIRRWFRW